MLAHASLRWIRYPPKKTRFEPICGRRHLSPRRRLSNTCRIWCADGPDSRAECVSRIMCNGRMGIATQSACSTLTLSRFGGLQGRFVDLAGGKGEFHLKSAQAVRFKSCQTERNCLQVTTEANMHIPYIHISESVFFLLLFSPWSAAAVVFAFLACVSVFLWRLFVFLAHRSFGF